MAAHLLFRKPAMTLIALISDRKNGAEEIWTVPPIQRQDKRQFAEAVSAGLDSAVALAEDLNPELVPFIPKVR